MLSIIRLEVKKALTVLKRAHTCCSVALMRNLDIALKKVLYNRSLFEKTTDPLFPVVDEELAPEVNVIKRFSAVSYDFS